MAEDLATALVAISENVAECQAELQLFRTEAMIEKVGDLYAHVFIFLSSYMDWMMRKRATRLLDSFNENIFRKFELDIQKINERSAAIRNLVAQSSRAELRETRLHVESLVRDLRVGQEGEARHRAEMEYFAARIERELAMTRRERRQLEEEGRQVKELASQLTRMLQERAMEWVEDERVIRTTTRGLLLCLPQLLSCQSYWFCLTISRMQHLAARHPYLESLQSNARHISPHKWHSQPHPYLPQPNGQPKMSRSTPPTWKTFSTVIECASPAQMTTSAPECPPPPPKSSSDWPSGPCQPLTQQGAAETIAVLPRISSGSTVLHL